MARKHTSLPLLKDLSRDNAAKNGDALAFQDSTESVTWSEFENRSQTAASIFTKYVTHGDRVGFYCKPSVQHAALFNGALKAGAITTNFHIQTAPESFRHCIRSVRPNVVVLDEELIESFHENITDELLDDIDAVITIGTPTYDYEQALAPLFDSHEPENPDVFVQEDDIAIIAWTSGSTGRPKGWCHTNRTMYLKGVELSLRAAVSRSEKQLIVNRPSFLIWGSFLTRAMLTGRATYYLRDWDPKRWLETVDSEQITTSTLVPTMWREVLDSEPEQYDLTSLDAIGSTGEKLGVSTLKELRNKICGTVRQSYGSTEIHSTILYNNELTEDRIESVGKPHAGTQIRIVDPNGTVDDTLSPGELGEIIIRSADAPIWAWENGDVVDKSFDDGWWRSGDRGYLDEDGYLYIEGRIDFQIKSKGVKIVPEPIEEVLTNHPDVGQAVVVGVEDETYGERVTAIIETNESSLTEDDLREWMLESDLVADHERPRVYHFVDEIERTPSGKLDRQSTKDRLE